MRIISANIPAPASKSTTSTISPAAERTRHQSSEARDSYNRNSGPQIIDAEYVEFYTPSATLFNQERSSLDNTLEPEKNNFETSSFSASSQVATAHGKYQLKMHEAPAPGSHIDIFA